MGVVIWIFIGVVFVYTMGFSLQLWKSKNKVGSFATAFVALTIMIIPFFVILI